LNSPWRTRTGRRSVHGHYLEKIVVELLGFNCACHVLDKPAIAPRIGDMRDVYRRAAEKWFVLPEVLAGFARFAKKYPASALALDGIGWIEAAAKTYDNYDWRHGVDDAVVEFLSACWKRDAAKIKANGAIMASFNAVLAIVVARGGHFAIALRDRVANS
jgi:hypothetical protein